MFTFNSDNIFVGYIKQLLHSFNLPKVHVYKDDRYLYDNGIYLKDNTLYQYYNNELKPIQNFTYNKKLLNYTRNLKIENNIYDSHTHEYLGEYLRFIRDYKHLDLMPLYNCFSNNLCTELYLTNKDYSIKFDSHDTSYKIYAIPVKYFKKYSIAISSESAVSVCCGFYNGTTNYTPVNAANDAPTTLNFDIVSNTYLKYANLEFNNIQVYDKLVNLLDNVAPGNDKNLLLQNEDNLRLFIKLPATNNSSIVILEGDVKANNNGMINNSHPYVKTGNYMIINHEYSSSVNHKYSFLEDFALPAPSQLLQLNTNISYVFADRLMEYLIDNTVTNMETISDNIKRLQVKIKELMQDAETKPHIPMRAGIWDSSYKYYLYDQGIKREWFKNSFDNLGYMDKTIERKLGKEPDIYEGE